MESFNKLVERVIVLDFERQVTEVHAQVLIPHRFTQLGTPETVRVA